MLEASRKVRLEGQKHVLLLVAAVHLHFFAAVTLILMHSVHYTERP